MWNTVLVDLELKDDAKPVLSLPYPVLKMNEAMFREEIERLVKLEVLKKSNDSELEAPPFAQSKAKNN